MNTFLSVTLIPALNSASSSCSARVCCICSHFHLQDHSLYEFLHLPAGQDPQTSYLLVVTAFKHSSHCINLVSCAAVVLLTCVQDQRVPQVLSSCCDYPNSGMFALF